MVNQTLAVSGSIFPMMITSQAIVIGVPSIGFLRLLGGQLVRRSWLVWLKRLRVLLLVLQTKWQCVDNAILLHYGRFLKFHRSFRLGRHN